MRVGNFRLGLAALVVTLTMSVPADAGLFGSIGHSLGIGGTVGKALDFGDSLLPGGGGPMDSILGAPGGALFGDAIKKWQAANEKTIDKLGETNDKTVEKLLNGLETLQTNVKDDVDSLAASLSLSITALDESLEKNIEKLDNSLTDQTQRLDTVFQKQTSTFFIIGRILLSVIIFGGFVYALFRAILNAPDIRTVAGLVSKRKTVFAAASAVAVVALLITWLAPDPGEVRALERRYTTTYSDAMSAEDFTNAQVSASQLTLLRPDLTTYRAWSLKAAAFRDMMLRPTMLSSDENARSLFVRLGRVNMYRAEEHLSEDEDVAATYALLAAIKAHKEFDFSEASIAFLHAATLSKSGNDASTPHIDRLRETVATVMAELRQDPLPREMLNQALAVRFVGRAATKLTPNIDDQKQAFLSQYDSFLAAPIDSRTSLPPSASMSLSSFSELTDTLDQKLVVRSFYRQLTSKYFAYLYASAMAATPGASAQETQKYAKDQSDAYCSIYEFYDNWLSSSYPKYNGSLSFVSNLLSGPFSILARAKAMNKVPNQCSALDDATITAESDVVAKWLTPLVASKLVKDGKSAILMRGIAKATLDQQNIAFDAFEKAFVAMKDLREHNLAGIADPDTRKKRADVLRDIAERSAVLGLYCKSEKDGRLLPAVYFLQVNYTTTGLILDETWQQATQAFLESRIGS